jgi:4-hydroxy-tetrahydrodipicolinate synthase
MAIPPLATALEEDQQAAYYGAIVEAVDVPVVVQDASGYVGQPLSIALQARLHAEYGPRVMFKPEAAPIAPRVSALRDATGGGAAVLEGTGGLALVDSHRRGIVGTMPGTDVCWALVALWAALEAGDQERVATVSGPLVGLIALQHSLDAFLAVEKHLLRRQGVFGNEVVRGPVGYRMDDETRADVDRLFTLLHHAVHGRELVDA